MFSYRDESGESFAHGLVLPDKCEDREGEGRDKLPGELEEGDEVGEHVLVEEVRGEHVGQDHKESQPTLTGGGRVET